MANLTPDYVINRYSSLRGQYKSTTSTTEEFANKVKIKASDAEASDYFGGSLYIRDGVAVMSAHGWGNNEGYSDGQNSHGAIYYYVKTGDSWASRTQHKLTSSVRQNVSRIGTAVADSEPSYRFNALSVDGERVVAGFPGWYDGSSAYPGQIIVWEKSGNKWIENHITASNPSGGDSYGMSVSTEGDFIIVGSPYEDTANTNSGRVYILTSGSTHGWREHATLDPNYEEGFWAHNAAYFGVDVSFSGSLLAVGAPGDDKVVVYRYTQGTDSWYQEVVLSHPSSSTGKKYGSNVSINNNTLAVGCPKDTGQGAGGAGAVFVYNSSSAGWAFEQGITPLTTDGTSNINSGRFGTSVDVHEDYMAIGSPWYSASAPDYGGYDGVAYLYKSGSTGWTRQATARPDDSGNSNSPYMGFCVSVSGESFLCGAYAESAEEGSQGCAYIYEPLTTTIEVDSEPTFTQLSLSPINIRKQDTSQHYKTSIK